MSYVRIGKADEGAVEFRRGMRLFEDHMGMVEGKWAREAEEDIL